MREVGQKRLGGQTTAVFRQSPPFRSPPSSTSCARCLSEVRSKTRRDDGALFRRDLARGRAINFIHRWRVSLGKENGGAFDVVCGM